MPAPAHKMLGRDVITVRWEKYATRKITHMQQHEMRDFNYLYFPLNWH